MSSRNKVEWVLLLPVVFIAGYDLGHWRGRREAERKFIAACRLLRWGRCGARGWRKYKDEPPKSELSP